ncbi:MAG TPA: MFS transporter [bacterium]|nr:MFS transporter [bacterium]
MTEANNTNVFKQTFKEVTEPFVGLVKASRALWAINLSYVVEGLCYFGVLSLLAIYFNDFVGLNDIKAGQMVGMLTAGITLAMLFLGATVDWIGPRKSLLISLAIMLVGRIILTSSTHVGAPGLWGTAHIVSILGMMGIVIGYGIYQPACYAAVKFFTTKETAAIGYAMLYALMNLGGFLPGLISPPLRKASGILGVFWVYVALTVVSILIIYFLLSRKTEDKEMENFKKASETTKQSAEDNAIDQLKGKEKLKFYIKNFPLRDGRFMFFIFVLIPVQTLFAHNWLTLPQYFSRAFTGVVQDNFEFFVNLNPILIFLLTPAIAVLTAKKDTYKMMIIGTFVMSLPTFILTLGPSMYGVIAFIVLMTIGEAMWQPRFLQWIAEIAPKNMTGIYMGIGQFPWFLTKVITSMYSGWFLMKYCPKDVPIDQLHTETMWLVYAFIAVSSPVGLIIARRWMGKDMERKLTQAA